MTNDVQHLFRRHIFGAERALLFVSDPLVIGDNVPHDHDFLEIVLVASGSGTHVSTHGSEHIGRGDFFVLRPGAWHGYRACSDLRVFNCCCAPELLRRELSMTGNDAAVTRLLWTEPLAPTSRGILHRRFTEDQTAEAVEHFAALAITPDEAFLERSGRLLILLSRLSRMVFPGEQSVNADIPDAVRKCVRMLEETYFEEWDLDRLASGVHLNPAYLSRIFKAAMGRAPMAYLARYRAERAANLLLTTDEPVGEIGARAGWPDPNYFTRRFKAVFGVTPSAYRAEHRSRGGD